MGCWSATTGRCGGVAMERAGRAPATSEAAWRALLLLRSAAHRLRDEWKDEWLTVAAAADLLTGHHTVEPWCARCGGSMPPPPGWVARAGCARSVALHG